MQGKQLFNAIRLHNILSFSAPAEIVLKPLNVIVGTNGSGKSNFIECIRVLKSSPSDLTKPFEKTGGIADWTCKHGDEKFLRISASVNVEDIEEVEAGIFVDNSYILVHSMTISELKFRVNVDVETIYYDYSRGKDTIFKSDVEKDQFALFRTEKGIEILTSDRQPKGTDNEDVFNIKFPTLRSIKTAEIKNDQSVLSQRSDPERYSALWHLHELYSRVGIFAESSFGRSFIGRLPQNAALDSSFLFEDGSNLALVLNDLQNQPQVMRSIIERLKQFYPRVENIITRVQGGTVQIYFQEEGLTQTVPATRLSDGTLRYLCLLVILCHPTPPPLICIEEPELGMHPDVIPIIAELLVEASQRTQLIVTTHSPMLVSAVGESSPEAVVVCERDENGTQMRRLTKDEVAPWLDEYALGDVWMKGLIGGTRW